METKSRRTFQPVVKSGLISNNIRVHWCKRSDAVWNKELLTTERDTTSTNHTCSIAIVDFVAKKMFVGIAIKMRDTPLFQAQIVFDVHHRTLIARRLIDIDDIKFQSTANKRKPHVSNINKVSQIPKHLHVFQISLEDVVQVGQDSLTK